MDSHEAGPHRRPGSHGLFLKGSAGKAVAGQHGTGGPQAQASCKSARASPPPQTGASAPRPSVRRSWTNAPGACRARKRPAAANRLTPYTGWRCFGSEVGGQHVQAALLCLGARQIFSLKRHEPFDCWARNNTDEKSGSHGPFTYSCHFMEEHERNNTGNKNQT